MSVASTLCQDHLHIRGENYEFDSSSLSLAGSPPHTWRKLAYFWANSSMLRITSTYVEKTACISLYASHSRDHLHIRGENVIVWHVWKADPGSPPHTWRKPDIPTRWSRDPRITSTYVEKTLRPRNAQNARQDHLHIRGENYRKFRTSLRTLGSPPHTWRKQRTAVNRSEIRRITSTYVEKTRSKSQKISSNEDHLHIRGENQCSMKLNRERTGSPPHTWRKLVFISVSPDNQRITSTYVEKTGIISTIDCNSWDHLHIRGENLEAPFQLASPLGSPPHTWRKRHNLATHTSNTRITSTYVEKTLPY